MEKKIEKLLKAAPKLRESEIDEINGLYRSFLFRRRKTGEIWTSCCGKHKKLKKDHPIMLEEHQAEMEDRRYCGSCGGFYPSSVPKNQKKTKCPFCGREGVVKEIGRSGNCKNLYDFKRIIVLRWYRGALWGMGYCTEKAYAPWAESFTNRPDFTLNRVWKFTPGRVQYTKRDWWHTRSFNYYRDIKTTNLKSDWKTPDGFQFCSEYGTGYYTIGCDELEKSPWKYCNVDKYLQRAGKKMRFLALCTGYPQQVEMLLKAGLENIVDDMAERGVKNAKILNWNEPDAMKSFGVDKKTLRAWLEGGHESDVLAAYKLLKKSKMRVTLPEMIMLKKRSGYQLEKIAKSMKKYAISAEKMNNYLQKQSCCKNAAELWADYLFAAEKLGYDLQNPLILIPGKLDEAHDKATKSFAAVKAELEDKKYRQERLKKLVQRYTFWGERYLIRPPVSGQEIVNEGKKLKHCVGGYAERHIKGTTTILFLRDKSRPGPLVTIEMQGNTIVQIHGYRNECVECKENPQKISPRKLYEDFLDEWLAWLEGGSKKDRKGYPIIYKKEKSA